MDNLIKVELFFDDAKGQYLEEITIHDGATIWDAILASRIYHDNAGIISENSSFGIFGKQKQLDYVPAQGSRIEVYRNLQQDPKERRKKLTKKKHK